MVLTLGNEVDLGTVVTHKIPLRFSPQLRDKHLYVCGATGTGKSKFLENLIRQDIINWSRHKCGLLLLDPHGSLYDSLMAWLARHGPNHPIVPIDLRRNDWIVAYNPLRKRKGDPAVIVDNFVEAMAYVWGQGNTDETPLFARWATNVLRTLYDNECTLVEGRYLTSRVANAIRDSLVAKVKDEDARDDWAFGKTLSPKEFDDQVGSTVNRFQRFVRTENMRLMFGQAEASLDIRKALDDGSIILVCLSGENTRISKQNGELFATLLLNDLWLAAQDRGKPRPGKSVKPFYLYVDEAQRFVTPTLAENLDEARGYGIHATLSNQFPLQFTDHGPNGKRVFNSIMENASSKVVFRLSYEENLLPMAKWLFTGTFDPDEIKFKLFSKKVIDYREEYRTIYAESNTSGQSGGTNYANSAGNSWTSAVEGDGVERWAKHFASSSGGNYGWSDTQGFSQSTVPFLKPIMGEELSHVQFRSLEEQLFRAMAVLFDQKERQAVARVVGMSAPVSIFTPFVPPTYVRDEVVEEYREKLLSKLPFALSAADAEKRIAERAERLRNRPLEIADEPTSSKRRIERPRRHGNRA